MSYDYKILREGEEVTIYRISDGAFIPKNIGNRDYKRFLKYCEDNEITEENLENFNT